MPKAIKLLENTRNRITKDENVGNVPHVEITEVLLLRCNIFNDGYY